MWAYFKVVFFPVIGFILIGWLVCIVANAIIFLLNKKYREDDDRIMACTDTLRSISDPLWQDGTAMLVGLLIGTIFKVMWLRWILFIAYCFYAFARVWISAGNINILLKSGVPKTKIAICLLALAGVAYIWFLLLIHAAIIFEIIVRV